MVFLLCTPGPKQSPHAPGCSHASRDSIQCFPPSVLPVEDAPVEVTREQRAIREKVPRTCKVQASKGLSRLSYAVATVHNDDVELHHTAVDC